ncbi:MAG: prolyl-tRNA synthetase [Candidatus Sungbacteria bacterium]|nr:prolyl-tRNA synthetase [Candidatus Sungbacteria bacterium]
MRQSQLFTKTRKDAPKGEVSKNADLLIRGGFIHKEMAGVYAYLPLGLRVVEKIKQIIREEMNNIGGQEIIMTALQRKELWEMTDRWDDANVDVWFKAMLKSGTEVGFGWSHEEPITDMMKHYLNSYRDLPIYVYQFQTKLRNELRAKSGIMRGREFVMKDMYSYTANTEMHEKFYAGVIDAYHRVFERIGLGDRTFLTFASGGSFTQFSHEFQTLTDVGEDTIYLHRTKKLAINQEVLTPEVMSQLGVSREDLEEVRAVEVGNIFNFGEVKSKQLGLFYRDEQGNEKPVILGSYGIGITRLMGTIVEILADEKGLVWPESIAPHKVHLIELSAKDDAARQTVKKAAEEYYAKLLARGIEVLYDDRADRSAGEKFADSDLIGIPWRVVVSEKTLAQKIIEVKKRAEKEARLSTFEHFIEEL